MKIRNIFQKSQIPHLLSAAAVQMLDNDNFGPGNRPYWEMKEGRVSSRYPDLLRTLSKVRPWPAEAIVWVPQAQGTQGGRYDK